MHAGCVVFMSPSIVLRLLALARPLYPLFLSLPCLFVIDAYRVQQHDVLAFYFSLFIPCTLGVLQERVCDLRLYLSY